MFGDEASQDIASRYAEYLDRLASAVGDIAVGRFVKHAGHLIKKLSFEEFSDAYLEYTDLLARYHDSVARGDTINDVVLKLLREQAANLVLPAPQL